MRTQPSSGFRPRLLSRMSGRRDSRRSAAVLPSAALPAGRLSYPEEHEHGAKVRRLQSLFIPEHFRLRTVVDICVLPMWDQCGAHDPSPTLTEELLRMLIESAEEWMLQEFRPHAEDVKVGGFVAGDETETKNVVVSSYLIGF